MTGPYGSVAARLAAQAQVDALVTDWCEGLSQAEIVEKCDRGEVPCGPVLSIDDILRDPHYRARGTLQQVDVPGIGPLPFPAPLPRLSASPGRLESLGPALGNATDDILGKLGLSGEELAELRKAGVI